jgi:hypothetical protein
MLTGTAETAIHTIIPASRSLYTKTTGEVSPALMLMR